MEGLSPITLWFRHLKDDKGQPYEDFNHIEDGHCANDVPTSKHESHKKVWGGKWAKEFAHLSDAVPPVVIHGQVI